MRAAASRTFCTAGNNNPMRIAIIAITTRSSMSVNADRARPRLERREYMSKPRRRSEDGHEPRSVYPTGRVGVKQSVQRLGFGLPLSERTEARPGGRHTADREAELLRRVGPE